MYVNPDVVAALAHQPDNTVDMVDASQVLQDRQIQVIAPDYKHYLKSTCPNYEEIDDELTILDCHMKSGVPVDLIGPKGVGKTLSVAYYAVQNTIPIYQFDCSENTRRSDLIGRFIPIGDEVHYQIGALASGIHLANTSPMKKCILVLEEINGLTPNMQKVLNQMLDWRKQVHIPELNKTFRLDPDAELLIVATMNPSTYGGVFELNEDLASRFTSIYVKYPTRDVEERMIGGRLDSDIKDQILQLAEDTRNLSGTTSGSEALDYALSPRDIDAFIAVYESYRGAMGDEKALKKALTHCVLNKYDDETSRETVKKRIFSTMAIEIDA
jgi:MoxR-like ATPase